MMKKILLTLTSLLLLLTARAQTSDTAKNKTAKPDDPNLIIDSGTGGAEKTGPIYTVVELMPEYPGGTRQFSRFLVKTIRYPARAYEHHTQGTVIVDMIVEKDGSLSDVKVKQGIGNGCDEEAVRVIKLSAPWKPGMQNGQAVRVTYSLPISFALAN